MNKAKRLMRNTPFRQQLLFSIVVGVTLLTLFSSLGSAWQGARQIRATLVEQGIRIAESLSRQSRLALLYDSQENAKDAVALTLTFPDVTRVEILRSDGRPLVTEGAEAEMTADANPERNSESSPNAYLELEGDNSWHFVAPVVSGDSETSPFSLAEPESELLGYVRVIQSKETLRRMMTDVFIVNLTIAGFFLLVFLLAIRLLAGRMTRPLTELSHSMAQAERGETNIRAEITGPKDISDVAHAFNSMMAFIEDREKELRRARDEALQFARLKAEFAATMSHEIRTPLNGVVGTLDMLMATKLPEKQHQFVEIAWDSAQYLLDLINNILDFSKLEAGKIQIEKDGFIVRQLIEDILDLLAQEAYQKGLEIGYIVTPETPMGVKGDTRLLRQILVDLVGNAIKFTESGEVSVNVSSVTHPDKKRYLRFEISDTGIGVTDEVRGRIFDSFTQGDTSTTKRYGGSGLGLSISKQLVLLMGGEIGVQSQQNLSSDFWFTLPLESWEAGNEAPRLTIDAQNNRVLVVDDSQICRLFLAQSLHSLGVEHEIVSDTNQALRALRSSFQTGSPFGTVVLDAGFTTAAYGDLPGHLRSSGQFGEPRLVVMGHRGSHAIATTVSADSHLPKPLRIERLAKCLQSIVAPGQEDTARNIGSPSLPTRGHRSFRILVVDDSRTNLAVAHGMLGMLGCETTEAENGKDAVHAFSKGEWDAVLLDCSMPEMDGYEAAGLMRKLEIDSPHPTPIIAMTANNQPEDIDRCLALGMDDHLAKPLTRSGLASKLQGWIPGFISAESAKEENLPQIEEPAEQYSANPIDSKTFSKLREALGENIIQAIQPFLEDMPGYLQELEEATAAGSHDEIRRIAHAIRGTGGNLGATRLASIAKEIESTTQTEFSDRAEEFQRNLSEQFSIVRDALIDEVQQDLGRPIEMSSEGALVLIVDDDRSTRSALRFALQRGGFQVEEASDGAQALALVGRLNPDVILMDAVMPVMDRFTACTKLKETTQGSDIPVLMSTTLESKQSIERAFAAGASDYITKPIHLAVVNQRIKRVVEATCAEQNVRHLAYNDVLTGLPNRIMFNDYLNGSIEQAEVSGHSLAVLFLDLDRFKNVNDTLGHEIGDRLLKSVAKRISNCVRSGDCVARLGGDEFTIVVDSLSSPSSAVSVAQKICRALGTPFDIDSNEIFVSASIGISVYPNDGTDVSTLLRHADTAMYRAKQHGSGFEFYEASMETKVSHQLRMEGELRRALERDEFLVYFQPCALTESGVMTSAEALVRWEHPKRGLVPPMEFIPVAEETGLIGAIGEWVLRENCRQTKRWLSNNVADFRIAVNISGRQLQKGQLPDTLKTVLRETGLDPKHLVLEITESVLMEHARDTISTLQELKDIGVGLAIDDFGTGYSSLSYLKRFPVDVLKIDRGFTRDMTTDADDAAIVSEIIALAQSLRLKVIAEGVETEEQRLFLSNLNCDYIQGYYLSMPLPVDEFEEKILSKYFPQSRFAIQAK